MVAAARALPVAHFKALLCGNGNCKTLNESLVEDNGLNAGDAGGARANGRAAAAGKRGRGCALGAGGGR